MPVKGLSRGFPRQIYHIFSRQLSASTGTHGEVNAIILCHIINTHVIVAASVHKFWIESMVIILRSLYMVCIYMWSKRKLFPPTTSNILRHTWTSLNYHSYVWTIIHTNSTFKKWQVIDGSAWTNSSKHQTMQRAQETTPKEKTLYACALQYIHHKNNPNSHVGCTCNAGCTYRRCALIWKHDIYK